MRRCAGRTTDSRDDIRGRTGRTAGRTETDARLGWTVDTGHTMHRTETDVPCNCEPSKEGGAETSDSGQDQTALKKVGRQASHCPYTARRLYAA